MSNPLLSVVATLDRKLAWVGGKSVRYLAVEVEAAEIPEIEPRQRAPLNLALVLDVSGSMSGEPLAAAVGAASLVVEQLAARDTVSVVSFADDVLVHAEGVRLDAANRIAVRREIESLTTRGSTNLGGGWMTAAKCAAKVAAAESAQSHIVLLSDGHANAGVTDPSTLERDAAQLQREGIATSTVGIGDGYSTAQLRALAEGGGGTLHDAQYPEEIAQVVLAELNALRCIAAEDVNVTVVAPPGVRLELVSRFPVLPGSEGVTAGLGGMVSQSKRASIWRLTCPPGTAGQELAIEARVSFIPAGAGTRSSLPPACATLTFAGGRDNTPQQRDERVALLVVSAWEAVILRQVTAMNRDGATKNAQRFLDAELPKLRRYCEGLSGLEETLAGLDLMRQSLNRRWSERSRKELEMRAMRVDQGKMDSRFRARGQSVESLLSFENPAAPAAFRPESYPLRLENGHPVATVRGAHVLIDTGSPFSIGNGTVLALPGGPITPRESVVGLDIKEVSGWVGAHIDILLGMDILSRFDFGLDLKARTFTVAAPGTFPFSGEPVPSRPTSGVPSVDVMVSGRAARAYLDTGAKLSYATPQLGAGVAATRSEHDFYPGIGVFETEVRPLSLDLGRNSVTLDFGQLPAALSGLLGTTGVEAIVGAELLCTHRLGFQPANRRVFIERQ